MIDIKDAELLNLLPTHMKEDIETQSLSYALKCEFDRLRALIKRIETIGNADEMDEELLDYFAVEWRTQYYSQDLDIEMKRKLVKNTMSWHRKAGTPETVKELVEVVFGDGDVVEWYDMEDGEPGTFSILTNAELDPDEIKRFQKLIQKTKNTRSHLAAIVVRRYIDFLLRIGGVMVTKPIRIIAPSLYDEHEIPFDLRIGGVMISRPIHVIQTEIDGSRSINIKESIAGVLTSTPRHTIYSELPEEETVTNRLHFAGVVQSQPIRQIRR